MSAPICVVLVAASAIPLHAMRPEASHTSVVQQEQLRDAYDAFRRKFGVERAHEDEKMYLHRAALLHRRSAEVEAHNQQKRGWVQVVNKFADFTDEEFRGMLGHRPARRARAAGAARSSHASSFLMIEEDSIAEALDYRLQLNGSLPVKDQGGCGSCWAVAVAGAMETQAELKGLGQVPQVSYGQLVDCVPNLDHCGGQGGCEGNTAEHAFEYIAKYGVAPMGQYADYQSGGDGSCRHSEATALMASGYVRLPENEARPLRSALAKDGPVVVSADASGWMLYSGGVFSGCDKDAIVNHAILMVGYGTDQASGEMFWLIRNSWGANWGEDGYIRLLRHDDSESYCGVDNKPELGVGCDGGPTELPVCGMCGILSDSAYPTGVQIPGIL